MIRRAIKICIDDDLDGEQEAGSFGSPGGYLLISWWQ